MATTAKPDPASFVPALGPERSVVWPQRTRRQLSNGLEVVLVESHNIPKFTGQLYFRSGNAAAASEAPGLAGITAEVVRAGTARRLGSRYFCAAARTCSGVTARKPSRMEFTRVGSPSNKEKQAM